MWLKAGGDTCSGETPAPRIHHHDEHDVTSHNSVPQSNAYQGTLTDSSTEKFACLGVLLPLMPQLGVVGSLLNSNRSVELMHGDMGQRAASGQPHLIAGTADNQEGAQLLLTWDDAGVARLHTHAISRTWPGNRSSTRRSSAFVRESTSVRPG